MSQDTRQPPESNPSFAQWHAEDPTRKRWIVAVLALVMFTHTMDFMVLMPLGPKLMNLFQISPQQFSWLVSIYSFSAGICGFLGALLFDRLDRKVALIGCYSGFLIGTLCCGLAPSYFFLLISRAIAGAFGGLLLGICFSIIGDLFSIHERGAATGRLMTSFSLSAIIGVPFGLIVANTFGWHATFYSIFFMGLLAIALAWKTVPHLKTHVQSHYSGVFSGLTENLRDPNSRTSLLTTFAMVLSQYVVIPFISPYLVSNTDFPENKLPLLYLLGGSITAFSGPWVGKLCDRFSPEKVFLKSGLLFLIPIFALTHLGHVNPWVTLSISSLFFVLSNARMVPAMTIISSSIPPSRRGSFMSLNSCLQQMGSASASFLAGCFVSQSMTASGANEITGFSYTAYLAIGFGLIAYGFGRRIRTVS